MDGVAASELSAVAHRATAEALAKEAVYSHKTGLKSPEAGECCRPVVCECSTMDSVAASEAVDPGSTPGTRTSLRSL